jgi:hypothetical protein
MISLTAERIEYFCDGDFLVDYNGSARVYQSYEQIKKTSSNFNEFSREIKQFTREMKIKKIQKIDHDPDRTLIYNSTKRVRGDAQMRENMYNMFKTL